MAHYVYGPILSDIQRNVRYSQHSLNAVFHKSVDKLSLCDNIPIHSLPMCDDKILSARLILSI